MAEWHSVSSCVMTRETTSSVFGQREKVLSGSCKNQQLTNRNRKREIKTTRTKYWQTLELFTTNYSVISECDDHNSISMPERIFLNKLLNPLNSQQFFLLVFSNDHFAFREYDKVAGCPCLWCRVWHWAHDERIIIQSCSMAGKIFVIIS